MIDLPEYPFGYGIDADQALSRIRIIAKVLDGESRDFFSLISDALDMDAVMVKGMSFDEWSDAAMVRMATLVKIVLNERDQ